MTLTACKTPVLPPELRVRLRLTRRVFGAALVFLSAMATAPVVFAGGPHVVERKLQEINADEPDEQLGFRNGSVVVAPIPFSNPTIGSGLMLGGGYLFKLGPNTKTSVLGLGALKSNNGSSAYGVTANLNFGNNKWLLKSFFGEADMYYDLYSSVGALPIRQKGTLGRLSLAYGVTPDLSFGAGFRYLDTNITAEIPGLPPIPPEYQPDLGLKLMMSSFIAEWDTRDDSDYATDGVKLAFDASYGASLGDDTLSYQRGTILFDMFRALGDTTVLAARGATCAATADTPFFDKCSIGPTDNFRGFSATQFLDQRLASAQVEIRQRFSPRFGAVAFAGVGWVGESYNTLSKGGPHAAGGVGLRYRVSKKFPVDFSVDFARNDLKDDLLYIYVGQRF